MAIHYKFKSAMNYDRLPVDGICISLADVKDEIIQRKMLGRGDLCELQITNAETKETYTDENVLIPKNSSLIIARVPIDRSRRRFGDTRNLPDKEILLSNAEYRLNTEDSEEAEQWRKRLEGLSDLTKWSGSEEEKSSAMIAQSTIEFHPSRYLKLQNTAMSGKVPPCYRCFRCNRGGHWISNCPFKNNPALRKSSRIPFQFLMEVDDPKTPGAMITATGKYVILRQSLVMRKKAQTNVRPKCAENVPTELLCLICKEMMEDATLTPCCAKAYCDECIRSHLLNSEDHVCPSCQESGVSPDNLVPNIYLRLKIQKFGNQFLTELPTNSESSRTSSPDLGYVSGRVSPVSPKIDTSPIRIERGSPAIIENLKISEEEEMERIRPKRTLQILEETEMRKRRKDEERRDDAEVRADLKEKDENGSRLKIKKKKKKKKKKSERKEKKHKKKKEKRKDSKDGGALEKETESKCNMSKEQDTLMNEDIYLNIDPILPPPESNITPFVPMEGYPVVRGGAYLHCSSLSPCLEDRSDSQMKQMMPYSRSSSRFNSEARSTTWTGEEEGDVFPAQSRRKRRRYSPLSSSRRRGCRSITRERTPSLTRSSSSGRRFKESPLSTSCKFSSGYSSRRYDSARASYGDSRFSSERRVSSRSERSHDRNHYKRTNEVNAHKNGKHDGELRKKDDSRRRELDDDSRSRRKEEKDRLRRNEEKFRRRKKE